MEMTKDVILARQLRLATISNLVGQGILDEPSAKELLSGALEPGNDSTIVDDSALLGDPEALVKIAAEQSVQSDECPHCHARPAYTDQQTYPDICSECGTRR